MNTKFVLKFEDQMGLLALNDGANVFINLVFTAPDERS